MLSNLAKRLCDVGYSDFYCLGTDINFAACGYSKELAEKYQLPVETLFLRSLGAVKSESLDIVVCNPPYVPSDDDELERVRQSSADHLRKIKEVGSDAKDWRKWTKEANLVEAAWVGGEEGIEFFEELITQAQVVSLKSEVLEGRRLVLLFGHRGQQHGRGH